MGPLSLQALIIFIGMLTSGLAQADLNQVKSALGNQAFELARPKNNDQIFSQYCIGDPDSPEIPQPNYQNDLVFKAAQKITESKTLADQRLQELRKDSIAYAITYLQSSAQSLIPPQHSPELEKAFNQTLAALNAIGPDNLEIEELHSLVAPLNNAVIAELSRSVEKSQPLLQANLPSLKGEQFVILLSRLRDQILQANLEPKRQETLLSLQALVANLNLVLSFIPEVDHDTLYTAIQSLEKDATALISQTPADLKYVVTNLIDQLRLLNKEMKKSQLGLENEADYFFEQLRWLLGSLQESTPEIYRQLNIQSGEALQIIQMRILKLDTEKIQQESLSLIGDLGKQTAANLSVEEINSVNYLSYSLTSWLESDPESLTPVDVTPASDTLAMVSRFTVRTWLRDLELAITNIQNQSFPQVILDASYTLNWMSEQILSNNSVPGKIKDEALQLRKLVGVVSAGQKLKELPDYLSQLQAATETSYELTYPYQELVTVLEAAMVDYFTANPTLLTEFKSNSAVANFASEITGQLASLKTMGDRQESDHFYFYSGVLRLYRLSSRQLPEAAHSAGANLEAHRFLTQLCGEYRDRASMIEAKLKWVLNMNILAKDPDGIKVIEPETLAMAENVWMRITAAAYDPFLVISEEIWEAKRASQERYLQIGSQAVDTPVDGFTVCETKYIFAEYIAQDRYLEDFADYQQGYEQFKLNCPLEDLSDYYDFRGDSNFKHYSPESNAMIWSATSLARGCSSPFSASDRVKDNVYRGEDCLNYFRNPFTFRFQAARAGLATWLFRDEMHAERFSAQDSPVVIHTHLEPHLAPFGFGFDNESAADRVFDFSKDWLNTPGAWTTNDIGFNALTGLDGSSPLKAELAYSLLRDAVDRHTDWYNSGYNDGNGVNRAQAYSPFVASSYVMTSSDNFTSCGTTVQCPPDGLKRWMFIFRVKAENWYTPDRLLKGEPVDFTKMWFDETSFGRSSLADSEHAWDRLGTPMEEELDSILYLINLEAYQGGEEGH